MRAKVGLVSPKLEVLRNCSASVGTPSKDRDRERELTIFISHGRCALGCLRDTISPAIPLFGAVRRKTPWSSSKASSSLICTYTIPFLEWRHGAEQTAEKIPTELHSDFGPPNIRIQSSSLRAIKDYCLWLTALLNTNRVDHGRSW